jgi:hypothetical protein
MDLNNFLNRGRIGSEYWVNSELKTFSEICKDNILQYDKWKLSKTLLDTSYSDKVLKPANEYAKIFSYKPEIICEKDTVILRYKTHSEIWFEQKPNGIYALDKVMQRQFYPSNLDVKAPIGTFDAMYKFYIPWIVDADVEAKIQEAPNSVFFIHNDTIVFNKINRDKDIWDVGFIHFFIKNTGEHIKEFNGDIFGIINVESPICDIIIKDKKLAKRILYEK